MWKLTAEDRTDIRWNYTTKLDDFGYAGDIALLSSAKEKLQQKIMNVSKHAHSTGIADWKQSQTRQSGAYMKEQNKI